ncbi:hypothetical protein OC846_003749 [Tilletia horrida]|uniref:Secreted protein n=1 Tax=Tilletia horrida TaxID=155126 RepID=A0AAN6GUA8_9BASI|nr:hypothetical protein OC846_003749 [Tilletia horrida]KAK0565414.1 hypothetical protein OC861_003784 [Tilletia horrida]
MFYPKLFVPALLVLGAIAAATPLHERDDRAPATETRGTDPEKGYTDGYDTHGPPAGPEHDLLEQCITDCKLPSIRECRYYCMKTANVPDHKIIVHE